MFCRYCGKQINEDAIFCEHCGKKLVVDANVEVKEETKEDVEDTSLKKFKHSYNRPAASCLIWFGTMSIIPSTLMTIGYAIVAIINGFNNIDLTNIDSILGTIKNIYTLRGFIIVPILYLIGYVAAFLIAFKLAKKLVYNNVDKDSIVFEKNVRKLTPLELILVILAAFGLWGIGVVIGNLPTFFVGSSTSDALKYIFGNYTYLYNILAMFGAPIFEELFFRKFCIDKTIAHGEKLAVISSALMFGLMHGNLNQFFLAFNLGLLFGAVYAKTRNIKYTMFLHFMINTFASLTEIFGYFNIDIMLGWNIATVILVVAGIVILLVFRKKEIFTLSNKIEYPGNKVFSAGAFKAFFIVLLVSVSASALSDGGMEAILAAGENRITPLYALYLIPIGAFVAFMIVIKNYLRNKMEVDPLAFRKEDFNIDLLEPTTPEINE